MPPIEVSICAEGSLPPEELAELADLGVHSRVDQVVLDGTVADQAALIGVLERLRRAGLRIRDVSPGSSVENDDHVTTLAIVGQVGALLRAILTDSVVSEHSTTTTAEVILNRPDDLFDVLGRLGSLGLELRSVHVGRSSDSSPGGGYS